MIKKRFLGFLVSTLLLVLLLSLGAAANNTSSTPLSINETKLIIKDSLKDAIAKNPWNETVIVSPTWQKVLSSFFGLNIKNQSSSISVREAIVLFMIFVMFWVIIYGVVKMIPFFNKKILGIPSELIASFVISALVSISGGFIFLKNFFLNSISYIATSLNFKFMEWALSNWWGGAILAVVIWLIIFGIRELFDWLEPFIKKYSEISRAQAKGRALNSVIQQSAPKEVTT